MTSIKKTQKSKIAQLYSGTNVWSDMIDEVSFKGHHSYQAAYVTVLDFFRSSLFAESSVFLLSRTVPHSWCTLSSSVRLLALWLSVTYSDSSGWTQSYNLHHSADLLLPFPSFLCRPDGMVSLSAFFTPSHVSLSSIQPIILYRYFSSAPSHSHLFLKLSAYISTT